MTAPVLTFFNNKGGVGKTSLIYHLAWMWASLGKRVVIVDLDPHANLTAALLEEDKIEAVWKSGQLGSTIYQCVRNIANGVGGITEPDLLQVASDLYLLPGDINLSSYEDILSHEWFNSMGSNNLYRPMQILSSFGLIIQRAAAKVQADIIVVDIGSNLGAINRSALIATDYAAIPLSADLFSLQGLKSLGPTLKKWKGEWQKRLNNWKENSEFASYPDVQLPQGKVEFIGYLCRRDSLRFDRLATPYANWLNRIPNVYREAVLNTTADVVVAPQDDPYCLATIKHYRSLIPMAKEHRKPIFNLTSADGAIGSHANAVRDARGDFKELAEKIAGKIGIAF